MVSALLSGLQLERGEMNMTARVMRMTVQSVQPRGPPVLGHFITSRVGHRRGSENSMCTQSEEHTSTYPTKPLES